MHIIKNKLIKALPKIALGLGILILLSVPAYVMAAPIQVPPSSPSPSPTTPPPPPPPNPCKKDNPDTASLQNCLKNNKIYKDVNKIIGVLAAGVGLVVVGSIIWGGIQYAVAGNNPNAVSAAKKRIMDSLIALLAFLFMFGFLQWIIPGGIFN